MLVEVGNTEAWLEVLEERMVAKFCLEEVLAMVCLEKSYLVKMMEMRNARNVRLVVWE